MSRSMVPSEIVLMWNSGSKCYTGTLFMYGRPVFTRDLPGAATYVAAEERFADEIAENFIRFFGDEIEN